MRICFRKDCLKKLQVSLASFKFTTGCRDMNTTQHKHNQISHIHTQSQPNIHMFGDLLSNRLNRSAIGGPICALNLIGGPWPDLPIHSWGQQIGHTAQGERLSLCLSRAQEMQEICSIAQYQEPCVYQLWDQRVDKQHINTFKLMILSVLPAVQN